MKKQCLLCHVPNCSLDDEQSISDCPINKFLRTLGRKRGMIVLLVLEKPHRYGELRRVIPDISEKMLLTTLQDLEKAQYISHEKILGKQIQSTYSITELGKKVAELATSMATFGKLLE